MNSQTMLGLVVVVAVTVPTVFWLWRLLKKGLKLPPSPGPALPVLGHLYLFKGNPIDQIKAWRQKLGNIYTVQFGKQTAILLNGYELISEALTKHHEALLARPNNFSHRHLFQHKGISSLGGEDWEEHRAFLQSTLETLGMGRNVMSKRIQTETVELLSFIRELKGKPVDFRQVVMVSVCNVITDISFSKRFGHKDEEIINMLKMMDRLTEKLSPSSVCNFFPFLRHIPGNYKGLVGIGAIIRETLWKWIGKNDRVIDPKDQSFKDVTQAFLIEMEKNNNNNNNGKNTIDEENLLSSVFALVKSGTDATSSTITFAVLYMVNFPDIQEKLFIEINEVVGTGRLPELMDKPKLKFLNAFIMETQRFAGVVPIGIDRLATQDFKLKGYDIPKGTSVMVVLNSLLTDQNVWGNPQTFRPSRFLAVNSNGLKKEFIPFSMGARNCIGEALATMELYIFLSALIQKFRFLPEHPDQMPSMVPTAGFTRTPQPFKVRAILRA